MKQFISLEEAVEIVKSNISELETEYVKITESLNRTLGEDIHSPLNQPPFDRSPLDGYAIRSVDTKGVDKENPKILSVVDTEYAGYVSNIIPEENQCIKITTGAPIPEGTDCIVKFEDTDEFEDYIRIYKEYKQHQNVCFAGEDFEKGSLMLGKYTKLTPQEIGILASMGYQKIKVLKKLKVGVLSTGDELVDVGNPLDKGKIYNSNIYTLYGKIMNLGCEPSIEGIVKDNLTDIMDKLKSSMDGNDILITTGGVSVGEKDLLMDALLSIGGDVLFWKIDIKPGTPVLCGKFGDKLIICLSGNPAASSVTFDLLFRPLVSQLNRRKDLNWKRKSAVFMDDFGKKNGMRRFLRGRYYIDNKKLYVELTQSSQQSGVLSSTLNCNCLIDVPRGKKGLEKGEEVKILTLKEI